MSPQPQQSLRPMSLHFFEEMFEPFIDQSRNITIRYQVQKEKPDDPDNFTIAVCSVNNSETPEDFHRHLTSLTDASVQQVDEFLQQQKHAYIDPLADYVIGKIDSLSTIVENQSILLHDEKLGGLFHCHLKSFLGARLIGPDIWDSKLLVPAIHYNTQKFVEVWLRVIQHAKEQVNLIRHMHKSANLAITQDTVQHKLDNEDFKIKFKISVDQEAYLFYLLVKSDIIDVPDRKSPQLIKWITNNLQSKNRKSNSLISLRNKYFYHQISTLDYWYQKLLDALVFINDERERILKYVPQ